MMKIEVFSGEYDIAKFYSLMGHFFGEREHRKNMPYLVNEEDRIWIIATENKKVVGFTTFIERKSIIDLGYTFATNESLKNELMDYRFEQLEEFKNKPLETVVWKVEDYSYWIRKGFDVIRETTNYIFLRKDVENNE
ncbi:hypothetical protein [Streptococcus sobrinus]|uniref:hypothetical protein n=1 Tax=Streptococcus sobrinus TaxID=1310 RepID=UPI0002E65D58|nr:hypothetical protein [Streptococcus sobrinus]